MKIKEYMRNTFFTIFEHATVQDALQMMNNNKTNGLVVIDTQGKPMGTIDSYNLIDAMTPKYLSNNPHLAQLMQDDNFYAMVSEILSLEVINLMEPSNDIYIQEEDSLMYAAALTVRYHFRYIPVMDAKQNLAGLMSRTEIRKAMGDIIRV